MERVEVMLGLLFYFFSAVAVAGALGVIINKNPVLSALGLATSFTCLGALFILLNAYLVGIMQILICAGVVTLLFLFVIMRTKMSREERRNLGRGTVAAGVLVAFVFMVQLIHVLGDFSPGANSLGELQDLAASNVAQIGRLLFSQYYFSAQVLAVLLVIAITGVMVLKRRELD